MRIILRPQMLTLKRTSTDDADFAALVKELDKDLVSRYGAAQAQYNPFNKVENIIHGVVVYLDNTPAGCGCFKKFDDHSVEMKRIFVDTAHRNKGVATQLMNELENWAKEEEYTHAVLETGTKQYEAIKLYEKLGYTIIDNYPPYVGLELSVCYAKPLV